MADIVGLLQAPVVMMGYGLDTEHEIRLLNTARALGQQEPVTDAHDVVGHRPGHVGGSRDRDRRR